MRRLLVRVPLGAGQEIIICWNVICKRFSRYIVRWQGASNFVTILFHLREIMDSKVKDCCFNLAFETVRGGCVGGLGVGEECSPNRGPRFETRRDWFLFWSSPLFYFSYVFLTLSVHYLHTAFTSISFLHCISSFSCSSWILCNIVQS